MSTDIFAAVAVSANSEWRAVRAFYPEVDIQRTPYGEYFSFSLAGCPLIFFHGGVGKISAAATAQYAFDRWSPGMIINLGTCGGLSGRIERGEILLVERTLVYDIIERMGDPVAAIQRYAVHLDLSWLREPYPHPVRRSLLVSADRDICPEDIPVLVEQYGAVAADWESGAIAWVANHHHSRCLILRGVSDLVGREEDGEAYDDINVYHDGARRIMHHLLEALPGWLACCQ